MSKPVKVSTALYESLQKDTSRLGITIQAALAQRLTAREAEAERLSALCDKHSSLLRKRESELATARNTGKRSASRIVALEAEAKEAQQAVVRLESERKGLEETVSELESEADGLDETLERERGERERRQRAYNGVLVLLAVAAVIGAGMYLWRKTRKEREQPAVSQQVNQNPGLPIAGWR